MSATEGKREDRTTLDKIEQARSIVRLANRLFADEEYQNDIRNALTAADVLLDDAGDMLPDEALRPAHTVSQ